MPAAISCWIGFCIALDHCLWLPTAGTKMIGEPWLTSIPPPVRQSSKMSPLLTQTVSTHLSLPPEFIKSGILSAKKQDKMLADSP